MYFQWIYKFWGIFFEEKKRTGMYKSSGDLTEVGILEFRKKHFDVCMTKEFTESGLNAQYQ